MTARTNLPSEVASFVGRETAMQELAAILLKNRLLTLTGTGGSGKTRLALRLADQMAAYFADGVWLVELAPISDSSLVPRAVAGALGIRGTSGRPLVSTLVSALTARRLLLVLDNCEHLIGACARLVETLLRACPHLRILSTSREPLRIAGEVTWRVPPLSLPPSEGGRVRELEGAESVALFVERAQAREPGLRITAERARTVAKICRRLEGLPLAIELAAAGVGALSIEEIASNLEQSLRLAGTGSRTTPRQETMDAAVAWSYELLDEPEGLVFRRLEVFPGSFDLEAAGGICGEPELPAPEITSIIFSLIDKSLVEVVGSQPTRYRLLDPVRQYAHSLLTPDEIGQLERSHAEYFEHLAGSLDPDFHSGRPRQALARLTAEQDNLRAALARCLRRGPPEAVIALRLVARLVWYWSFTGFLTEGLEWLERALERGGESDLHARARALWGSAELAWLVGRKDLAWTRIQQGVALCRQIDDKRVLALALQSLPMTVDRPEALAAAEESLALFQELEDEWGISLATAARAFAWLGRDPKRAEEELEKAAALSRRVGDEWGLAQCLNIMGDLARGRGDDALAKKRYEESLLYLERQALTATVPSVLHNLGHVALRQGEIRRARALFCESLDLFQRQGDQKGIADCLDGIAGVMASGGRLEEAARLFGAAEALRESLGVSVWPANVADYEHNVTLLRENLDEARLHAAWNTGRAMSFEEAEAEANPDSVATAESEASAQLTPRELEVARLVARGLSSREIGKELFITEGTARLHVKHILRKLDFSSRAQIAAWAVSNGLAP